MDDIFPYFLLFYCPLTDTLHYNITNQPTKKNKLKNKTKHKAPLVFKRNSLLLFHSLPFIFALFFVMRENISILLISIYNSLSSVDAHLGEKWTTPLNVLHIDRWWSFVRSTVSTHFQSPSHLVTILQHPKAEFTAPGHRSDVCSVNMRLTLWKDLSQAHPLCEDFPHSPCRWTISFLNF